MNVLTRTKSSAKGASQGFSDMLSAFYLPCSASEQRFSVERKQVKGLIQGYLKGVPFPTPRGELDIGIRLTAASTPVKGGKGRFGSHVQRDHQYPYLMQFSRLHQPLDGKYHSQ